MVSDFLKLNTQVLNSELEWFVKLLDTRLKLHFGHDCEYQDVYDIPCPTISPNNTSYAKFINYYQLSFEERVVLLLALIPHIKPQLLDVFYTKNAANDREFTEFGGRNGSVHQGFLPTAQTALFILAGENLEKRLRLLYLFHADHVFQKYNILNIDRSGDNELDLNGVLHLSRDTLDMLTTGVIRKPNFGPEFPAKRIETALTWDDLVLDYYTMQHVLEIKAWIDFGDEMLYDLELGQKLKPGYRVLFHGPAGTGKTLTATLLGKVTERDVYRIDLSMVISKYIGETEKNLEKVFRQVEHKNWILFFDEADALFGKRTNISDAHDRFANQEVSYLLQRVEDYAGVVILASNMKSNLDEAFLRRFQSVIYFPMPEPNERYRLWQNAFSIKTPLSDQINLKEIAAQFELSGGSIMNVVRYATLMALRDKTRIITIGNLMDGIRKEFNKEGKSL
ncbi:ATP-binding protein [candidate division KSB1 bacterium]|nr:ATP-binding protein [candidate division KSB1 bacterium]RQW07361.1 MAG: ATP-binding protein [candidate division KSB1 bacterium]